MTDKEKHKFYHSGAWQRKRDQILRRDHYECQDCRTRITTAARNGTPLQGWQRYLNRATCVHHIRELADAPEQALSDDNLISLCDRCHNARHGRTAEKIFTRRKRKKPLATEERW